MSKSTIIGKSKAAQEAQQHGPGGHKKKSALALLLLFLPRKQVLLLLAAGMLVFFVLGASFGFDLGRMAGYFASKPGFSWLASAIRTFDQVLAQLGIGVDDSGKYADMYTDRDASFNAEAYRRATTGKDGVNPESLIAGGGELVKEDLKLKDSSDLVVPVHPDDAKQNDAVVQVPEGGPEGPADSAAQVAKLGASAFGSSGLFSGPVGGAGRRDSLAQRMPDPTKKNSSVTAPDKKQTGGIKQGRLSRYNNKGRNSRFGANKQQLAIGNRYRFRLSAASYQTHASLDMGLEDSTVYNRAWATGEEALSTIDEAGTPPAAGTPATPSAGAGGQMAGIFDIGTQECASAGAELGQKMADLEKDMRRGQCQLHQAAGNSTPSCTDDAALAAWKPGSIEGSPDCCDHGKVRKWNGAMDTLLQNCLEMQTATKDIQKECLAMLGTDAEKMECKTDNFPHLEECGDSECCVKSFMDFLPGWAKFLLAPLLIATYIAVAVVGLLTGAFFWSEDFRNAMGSTFWAGLVGAESDRDKEASEVREQMKTDYAGPVQDITKTVDEENVEP